MDNNLKLVNNNTQYFEFIRQLRNDKLLSSGFIDQHEIAIDEQQKYMENHKDDYYIALLDNDPVGFIGIVDNDLRLAVKKEFQRKGVASFMIKKIVELYPDVDVQVKENNLASLEMFQKNGFIIIGKKVLKGHKLILMKIKKSN
jgi:ribosomal protein S18 acetylase RimI-like enzyme